MSRSSIVAVALATLVAAGPGGAQAPSAVPVCEGSTGYANAFDGRRTLLWRADWLAGIKARFDTDPILQPARIALMARADAALTREPYTVVDKTQTPESGDRHDYMSMGPYWWPDRTQPRGLPYIRRDGQVNPERETNAFDLTDLENFSQDVQVLSLAYYFTDDEQYATQAARLVRVWFLDPETRMNPNLNHGQAIPGRVAGRAEGVIDAVRFVRVIESLGLLDVSPAPTDDERAGLRDWFARLVDWMATSEIGREERAATNNHGVFYDMLISHFALYAGMDEVARAVSDHARAGRIAAQVAPDGSLPEELTRTRSFHYSTWTLTAAFDLAQLGQCVGVDLWNFETEDGRSLRAATNFVAAYAGRSEAWPYPEIDKDGTGSLYEVLQRGAWAWGDADLAAKAALYRDRHAAMDLNLRVPTYAP